MENGRLPTRRLRIFLRDFRLVEATVMLAEGQALAPYFSHRKNYLNLKESRWVGTGDDVSFAVLKVPQVLWACAMDGDVPLTNASVAPQARDPRLLRRLRNTLAFRPKPLAQKVHELGVGGAARLTPPPRTFPAAFPWLRLDRIYQRGFAVRHAKVLHGMPWKQISDHAPLFAELELP